MYSALSIYVVRPLCILHVQFRLCVHWQRRIKVPDKHQRWSFKLFSRKALTLLTRLSWKTTDEESSAELGSYVLVEIFWDLRKGEITCCRSEELAWWGLKVLTLSVSGLTFEVNKATCTVLVWCQWSRTQKDVKDFVGNLQIHLCPKWKK